jgi:hypothetical protein
MKLSIWEWGELRIAGLRGWGADEIVGHPPGVDVGQSDAEQAPHPLAYLRIRTVEHASQFVEMVLGGTLCGGPHDPGGCLLHLKDERSEAIIEHSLAQLLHLGYGGPERHRLQRQGALVDNLMLVTLGGETAAPGLSLR